MAQLAGAGLAGSSVPVVIMYHSVIDYDEDPYLVTVSPARLRQQLGWLLRRGLRGVSVAGLVAARQAGDGRGLVGLTFDDGYADFISNVLPALADCGFGATVFPIAGRLGGQNDWDVKGPRKPLMTADQVRQAAGAGIEIGSHGLRHVSLPGTSDDELAAEASQSRAILQQASGQPVTGFCYPYGHLDERAVAAVRAAGYSYGCAIWRSEITGLHTMPRFFVGDADRPWRLWAKGVRHWLCWDYRGPGAGQLAQRLSPTAASAPGARPGR
ncbi:MAG: polysaccharide deacetylase family protein [Nocardiopsaceae bacterium]|jgi:peptidoglycan/xylan/chitin deacetylase (PgdA/CDA1 family)|nr:polysaccharide deacetylase family protein [Nocardiopsaceae bacterium]